MGHSSCRGGGDVDDSAWMDLHSRARLQGEGFSSDAGGRAIFSRRTEQSIPVVCCAYSPGAGCAKWDHGGHTPLECNPNRDDHA